MMGIMLGLIVGCAAALLVEMLDNSFKKVEDVEEMLGLPVIGVTPKIEFLKRSAESGRLQICPAGLCMSPGYCCQQKGREKSGLSSP